MASYPTFNPNAFRQSTEAGRRNRAIQDLYEPGSTFKIITASAALEERVVRPHDLIDVSPGYIKFGSRVDPRRPSLRRADLRGRGGVLEQRRRDQGRAAARPRAVHPLRARLRIRRPAVARLPRREPRHRLGRGRADRQRAGLDADRLPGRRHAAADGHGRQRRRQRRRAAAAARGSRRDARRRAHRGARRRCSAAPSASAPRRSCCRCSKPWSTKGTAKVAQMDGYTVAGKTGTAKKLVNGSYRGHSDYNASFVGFVPSRTPRFTIVVVVDSPHACRPTAASWRRRSSSASARPMLRYEGVPRTINPVPPVVVVRGGRRRRRPAGRAPGHGRCSPADVHAGHQPRRSCRTSPA